MYHNIEKYLEGHFVGFNINARKNFEKWAKRNQITKYCDDPNWVKLLPSFNQMRIFHEIKLPSGCDHQEMFQDKDKNRYYIFHPYINSRFFDKEEIEDWAYRRGLKVEILSPDQSWYLPGNTYTVVISVSDADEFFWYVKRNRIKDNMSGGGWVVR